MRYEAQSHRGSVRVSPHAGVRRVGRLDPNATIVYTWLRHFIGAEKVHADSQSRHMSHSLAGRTLRQAGWTYAKTLHQIAQGGAHTVRRSQTRSKLYPPESSGSRDVLQIRPFGSSLMRILCANCIRLCD